MCRASSLGADELEVLPLVAERLAGAGRRCRGDDACWCWAAVAAPTDRASANDLSPPEVRGGALVRREGRIGVELRQAHPARQARCSRPRAAALALCGPRARTCHR